MALSVPIDTLDVLVTPVFKYITNEDVPKSEQAGHLVMRTIEVVEARFAGSRNYSPIFPTDAFWRREGQNKITYAERWADQYRAFLDGSDQRAPGTPLEMLRQYGITDGQLSLCRALKIYSIEALENLEGPNLKSLQMNANPLKDMARKFAADRAKGGDTAAQIADLQKQIEALTIPKEDPNPAEIDAAIAAADYDAKSDEELKAIIKARAGKAPTGNVSHQVLVNMARELEAA
jgi:hypothetical protein